MKLNPYRQCPACHRKGILISELYPTGTQCQHCTKHVEVDALFNLLAVGLLVTLMILDFNFWGFEFVGLICVAALLVNAFFHQRINANFMPLKQYDDDISF